MNVAIKPSSISSSCDGDINKISYFHIYYSCYTFLKNIVYAYHYFELQHLFDFPLDLVNYGNKHIILCHNYLDNFLFGSFIFLCILFYAFKDVVLRRVPGLHQAVGGVLRHKKFRSLCFGPWDAFDREHSNREHSNICVGRTGRNVGYIIKS